MNTTKPWTKDKSTAVVLLGLAKLLHYIAPTRRNTVNSFIIRLRPWQWRQHLLGTRFNFCHYFATWYIALQEGPLQNSNGLGVEQHSNSISKDWNCQRDRILQVLDVWSQTNATSFWLWYIARGIVLLNGVEFPNGKGQVIHIICSMREIHRNTNNLFLVLVFKARLYA